MSTDWTPWLGPAADELTPEQRERFNAEAEEIIGRMPGDESDPDVTGQRGSALEALVQYLLGETTIDQAREERRRTQDAALHASLVAQQVARLAVQDGMPEAEAARRAGLDRMTVRKVLGKR